MAFFIFLTFQKVMYLNMKGIQKSTWPSGQVLNTHSMQTLKRPAQVRWSSAGSEACIGKRGGFIAAKVLSFI